MASKKPTSRAAARTTAQKKSPARTAAATSAARKSVKAKDRKTKARAVPAAKRARPKQRIAISHHRAEDFKPNGLRAYAHYRDLGFADYKVKLATRPDQRIGNDEEWDRAEADLETALKETGLPYELLPGEGAFYGPKLEFHLQDAIGRTWQCGTLQLDPQMPQRLGAVYIGEDGGKHHPLMLHRAVLGTFERFIGILIEHHAGKFPLWLAPVQAVVATIVSDADDYARQVAAKLGAAGIRVETDLRNEKINYKVREHSLAKVPLLLVVGKREAEEGTVALRRLGSEERQVVMTAEEALAMMTNEAVSPDLR